MRRRTSLAAALLATLVPWRPGLALEDSPTWDVWYSVGAQVRGTRADADIEAGGRLAMTGTRDPSGALRLSLAGVLEHPWKLYWVDPIGPLREEVKVASVVSLSEPGWEALETARAAAATAGETRHRSWLARAERPRQLDGTFAFVVIGPPRDRFEVQIGASGTLTGVANRVTDRWLPGPFDQFLENWTSPGNTGYWFWNEGELEPFDYEPHTYHAFSAALELLELPLPGPRAETVNWGNVGVRALRVLETLAPKAKISSLGSELARTVELGVTRAATRNGGVRVTLTTAAATPNGHAERETMFSSTGTPVSDRLRVRLTAPRAGALEIEVGYRPTTESPADSTTR